MTTAEMKPSRLTSARNLTPEGGREDGRTTGSTHFQFFLPLVRVRVYVGSVRFQAARAPIHVRDTLVRVRGGKEGLAWMLATWPAGRRNADTRAHFKILEASWCRGLFSSLSLE